MIAVTDDDNEKQSKKDLTDMLLKAGNDNELLSILDYHSEYKILIGKDFEDAFSLTPIRLSNPPTEVELNKKKYRNAATKFLNNFRRISILNRWYKAPPKALKSHEFDADFRTACDICTAFLSSVCHMKIVRRVLFLALMKSFRNGREVMKDKARKATEENKNTASDKSNIDNAVITGV